jgi:hypothetical protein
VKPNRPNADLWIAYALTLVAVGAWCFALRAVAALIAGRAL